MAKLSAYYATCQLQRNGKIYPSTNRKVDGAGRNLAKQNTKPRDLQAPNGRLRYEEDDDDEGGTDAAESERRKANRTPSTHETAKNNTLSSLRETRSKLLNA